MTDHLNDFPPGTDPIPCWIWKGGVRRAREETITERNSENQIITYKRTRAPSPVCKGGRRPFQRIALQHGLRLIDLTNNRPGTCDPLCVNPFHRLAPKKVPTTKAEQLLIDIRAFLPSAQTEDEIYDEFLLRGHEEDDITYTLEKLREDANTQRRNKP